MSVSKLPAHWQQVTDQRLPKMVELAPDNPMYIDTKTKFEVTTKNAYTVLKIENIQHAFLWRMYEATKRVMVAALGTEQKANEGMYWHGTKAESINIVATQGFRREYCTSAAYGWG